MDNVPQIGDPVIYWPDNTSDERRTAIICGVTEANKVDLDVLDGGEAIRKTGVYFSKPHETLVIGEGIGYCRWSDRFEQLVAGQTAAEVKAAAPLTLMERMLRVERELGLLQ